jgi:O-antigen/teichoic acid export membrane protein
MGANRASAEDIRTVAKGSIIQFLGTGTNRASSVVFVAIAIRLLGAAGFGMYRQIAQLLMTTSTIATLGFDAALLRSVARARARGEQGAIRSATRMAGMIVTVVSSAFFLVLVLAAGPIAGAFADEASRQSELAFLIRLGAAYVPLYALTQLLSAGTTGFKTVVPSVLIGNVLQPVSLLILSTAAIMAGYGVAGAMGGFVASALVALVAVVGVYRRLLPREEERPSALSSFRSMAGFALPRAGASALRLGGAGTLLLGLLGTDRDVALFAVAISLQSVVLIFPQAFISIWKPMVVDLVERKETERLRLIYQTVSRWVASFSFGFIIALIVLPEPFVQILGGGAVRDAVPLTSIVALGTLFQVVTGPCGMLITMAGYPTINLLNSISVTTMYAIAAWLIVPTHGVVAMAIIHGTATAVSNLILVIAAKWLTSLQPFGRSFLKPLVSTVVAGFVLVAWRLLVERILFLDLLGLIVAGAAYGGTLWAAGMDAEDRMVYERIRARLAALRPLKRDSAAR